MRKGVTPVLLLKRLVVASDKSSCCSINDQEIATRSGWENFRQAGSRARNKHYAVAIFDSVGIAIFAKHSTASMQPTIIFQTA
jgi:hypothetical protein